MPPISPCAFVYPGSDCEPMWCLSHHTDRNKRVCVYRAVGFLPIFQSAPLKGVCHDALLLGEISAMPGRFSHSFDSLSWWVERGKGVDSSWKDAIFPLVNQIQGSLSRLKEQVCLGNFLGWGKDRMRSWSTWMLDCTATDCDTVRWWRMWVSNICLAIRGSAFRIMACSLQGPHGYTKSTGAWNSSAYSIMSQRKYPGQRGIPGESGWENRSAH